MKTFVIGDIHGCSLAFLSLLKKLQPDPSSDRLILLGDLFDRGPDSWQVFQTAKQLAWDFKDNFILLRGNHEDYLLQQKLPLGTRIVWERVGRQATVRSFKQHQEKMEDARPWLLSHCRDFWKGEDFQCVHAGLREDPPENNDTYTLLHDHDIVLRNEYSGPLTITGHIALSGAAWFAGDGEHVASLKEDVSSPLPRQGIICIDTGCGKGGRLTALIAENGEYTLTSVAQNGLIV